MESQRSRQVRLRNVFVSLTLFAVSFWTFRNVDQIDDFLQRYSEWFTALLLYGSFFAAVGALFRRALAGAVFGTLLLLAVAVSDELWPLENLADVLGRIFGATVLLGAATYVVIRLGRRIRRAVIERVRLFERAGDGYDGT